MLLEKRSFPYGNLQAYKTYIMPNLYRILFQNNNIKNPKNKHAENILYLLTILSRQGVCTTWQIAKNETSNNMEKLRTKEKEYRRLIIGRNDKKRHNIGLLELGLVVQDGFNFNRAPAAQYRLSLHGILCCIDILDLDDVEIDKIASTYSDILPKVFGKWEFLRSIVGKDIYKIKILAKGIILDSLIPLQESDFVLSELMSFVHVKYKHKLENIDETELAEQISFWFYTNLLYHSKKNKQRKLNRKELFHTKLAKVLSKDTNLKKWYDSFLIEIKNYHKTQYNIIRQFKIS